MVTAARVPQSMKETPTSVIVIDAAELANRGALTLGAALEALPGVMFHQDGMNRSHVTVRGTDSRHSLILVDGKRMANDVSKTLANPGVLETIGTENIERIEVVKGTASALYGSEAIGGVINIITKKEKEPSFLLRGSMGNFSGGSRNQYDYHFAYDSGRMDALHYRVSYGARKTVPQWNESGGTSYYHGLARPLSLQIGYSFDESHELVLAYDYQKYKQQLIGGWEMKSKPRPHKELRADTKNKLASRNMSLTYTGTDGAWEYMARTYRNQFTKDYYTHIGADYKTADYSLHREMVFEGQATRDSGMHRLTLGAEYRNEKGISTRMLTGQFAGEYRVGNLAPIPKYEDTIHYYSAYAQDEWRPNDKWLLVPALRYDYSNRFGGRISPKFGGTYFADDTLRFKMNIGTGYVTPGLMELNYNFRMFDNVFMGPHLGFVSFYWVGNPDLQPEKSFNFEIGAEKDWSDGMMKVTCFYNEIKDYIASERIRDEVSSRPGPMPGMQVPVHKWYYQNRNLTKVRLQGIEFSGNWRLGKNLDIRYGYTWLDAKDSKEDERLTDRPRHKFDLGLHYRHQAWSVSLWGNYYVDYLDNLDSDAKGNPVEKNFGLVNLLIGHRWDNGVRLYAGVDNLFDAETTVRSYTGRFYKVGMEIKL